MSVAADAQAVTAAMPELQTMVCAGALVMLRISGLFVFAPIFSSPAIAPRIKAGFVFAITLLMTPVIVHEHGAITEITVSAVLSELAVGLVLGLSLLFLGEAVLFTSTLLGMEFSFSLVNIVDPNSKIETPVMGELLNWVMTLVLLAAGLHRTLLAALLKTFEAVPVGSFLLSAKVGVMLMHMAGGLFLAGVQLASPVVAAALTVEVTIGLVARLSPQLPAMIMSVPIKTMVSYVVLMGSLAVWPWFLERRFDALLDGAGRLLVMR